MGAGNAITRMYRFSSSVLKTTGHPYAELKNRSKCLKPTQGLPTIPRAMRKSLKAMIMPYMGT